MGHYFFGTIGDGLAQTWRPKTSVGPRGGAPSSTQVHLDVKQLPLATSFLTLATLLLSHVTSSVPSRVDHVPHLHFSSISFTLWVMDR